jgi:hypothetical protein
MTSESLSASHIAYQVVRAEKLLVLGGPPHTTFTFNEVFVNFCSFKTVVNLLIKNGVKILLNFSFFSDSWNWW